MFMPSHPAQTLAVLAANNINMADHSFKNKQK
jgi:hypothetical protein